MKRKDITTLSVLLAARIAQEIRENIFVVLGKRYPTASEKLLLRAVEREIDAELLEFGCSIRRPWLSAEGEERLVLEIDKINEEHL